MSTLLQDLRFGLGLLVKSPAFTIAAVVCLAILSLGTAANRSVLGRGDATLARPPAVAGPGPVVALHETDGGGADVSTFAYLTYVDLESECDTFSHLCARLETRSIHVLAGEHAVRASGGPVRMDHFEILGLQPAAARPPAEPGDAPGGGAPAAVISYDLWQRVYGGDPTIVGRAIRLDGRAFTVTGVAPRPHDPCPA